MIHFLHAPVERLSSRTHVLRKTSATNKGFEKRAIFLQQIARSKIFAKAPPEKPHGKRKAPAEFLQPGLSHVASKAVYFLFAKGRGPSALPCRLRSRFQRLLDENAALSLVAKQARAASFMTRKTRKTNGRSQKGPRPSCTQKENNPL